MEDRLGSRPTSRQPLRRMLPVGMGGAAPRNLPRGYQPPLRRRRGPAVYRVLLGRREGVRQTSPSATELRADAMNDAWVPLTREPPPVMGVPPPPHGRFAKACRKAVATMASAAVKHRRYKNTKVKQDVSFSDPKRKATIRKALSQISCRYGTKCEHAYLMTTAGGTFVFDNLQSCSSASTYQEDSPTPRPIGPRPTASASRKP